MHVLVHGIKACDSCRRACRALDEAGIAYRFRDLRAQPPAAEEVHRWLDAVGADALINRRSRTWRELDAATRALAGADPVTVLCRHPTLIRRPLFDCDGRVRVGPAPGGGEALAAWLRAAG